MELFVRVNTVVNILGSSVFSAVMQQDKSKAETLDECPIVCCLLALKNER